MSGTLAKTTILDHTNTKQKTGKPSELLQKEQKKGYIDVLGLDTNRDNYDNLKKEPDRKQEEQKDIITKLNQPLDKIKEEVQDKDELCKKANDKLNLHILNRGLLSDFLSKEENARVGNFYSVKNEAGGQVFVSTQNIRQTEIANIVSSLDDETKINIISGRHCDYFDNVKLEPKFYEEDALRFKEMKNVKVYNYGEMSMDQIEELINSSDITILGWCCSEYSSFMRENFK